jgi:hypothetical protein
LGEEVDGDGEDAAMGVYMDDIDFPKNYAPPEEVLVFFLNKMPKVMKKDALELLRKGDLTNAKAAVLDGWDELSPEQRETIKKICEETSLTWITKRPVGKRCKGDCAHQEYRDARVAQSRVGQGFDELINNRKVFARLVVKMMEWIIQHEGGCGNRNNRRSLPTPMPGLLCFRYILGHQEVDQGAEVNVEGIYLLTCVF